MIKKKTIQTDILISGAGSPGLLLALLLADLGLAITLVDPQKPPKYKNIMPEGRTSALMQSSINVIKAAKAWDKVEPFGAELRTLRIIDDTGESAKQVDFTASDIDMEAFGLNMPNNVLLAALADTAKGHKNITLLDGETIQHFDAHDVGITATLHSGKTIHARLLVGADGRGSPTREISNIKADIRDYGQSAITCILEHSKPHHNISTEFHRPSGPFTLVPMATSKTEKHQSSLVWVDTTENCEKNQLRKKQDFEKRIQELSRNALGTISLVSTPQSYPLKSLQAKTLIAPRVALIAEAAHVLHPMGAQGLNLSIRDVASLAETIADQLRLGMDIGSVQTLSCYAKRRAADIRMRYHGSDLLTKMVSNHSTFLSMARRKTLSLIDHVVPIKTFLMRHGLQDQSDTGRLGQGKAL